MRYSNGVGHHSASLRAKKLPGHIIATVRAFGGFTLLLTKRHKIVYASELAASIIPRNGDALAHPELLETAQEAWTSREHIARPYSLTTLGPFHEVVIQAVILEGHWVLVSLIDRTAEVQATQIRKDFVSNIGHELRTPVTSVGLIAQALHSCAGEPSSVEHFAQRLDRVAQRLESLSEGMLALAQAQENQSNHPWSRIHSSDLVDRALSQALETARSKGIKLKTKKRANAWVEGDAAALATAVENLISNAVHYSPKGSRVIIASQADEAEDTVTFSVIDQGIGIVESEQERVFERFYRTDQARSQRSGGTGLGLAIVKHTALSHGGSVSVDSHVGSGSTFSITLPIAPGNQDEETLPIASVHHNEGSNKQ